MNELSARDEMRKRFDKKQPDLYAQSTLAYIGKQDGTILVPERPGYIYVSIANAPPIQVLNRRVPPELGRPVVVGIDPYEPWLLQVLSSVTTGADATAGSDIIINYDANVGPHAPTHSLLGTDPIWVDKRSILPGRIGPADYYSGSVISGSAAIEIFPEIVMSGGIPYELPYQVVDLSAHIPGSGSSVYVLVSLAGAGAVVLTAGSVVAGYTPALTDAPHVPTDHVPLGYVRLYGGMTGTNENADYTDFIDTRTMIPGLAATSGSGGSGSTTPLSDATPQTITDVQQAGTSGSASRGDHMHSFDLYSSVSPTDAAGITAAGSSVNVSRGDHSHSFGLMGNSVVAIDGGSTAGTSPYVSRQDHKHGFTLFSNATPEPLGAASAGTSGSAARSDHVHSGSAGSGAALADTTPANVGTSGAPGTSGSAARSDHVHAGSSVAGVALANTTPANVGTAAAGTSGSASRSDHVHAGGGVTNKILLFKSGSTLVNEYAATEAGFDSAMTAAVAGDMIQLPVGNINLTGTERYIFAGISVRGFGRVSKLTFTGGDGLYLQQNAILRDFQVAVSGSSTTVGVVVNTDNDNTEEAHLYRMLISVVGTAGSAVHGIRANIGTLHAHNCEITTSTGVQYIYNRNGGAANFYSCVMRSLDANLSAFATNYTDVMVFYGVLNNTSYSYP
jgi:hypothetical protein